MLKWHNMTPYPTKYCLLTDLTEMRKWAKKNKVGIPDPETNTLGGVYAAGSYIFVLVNPDQSRWNLVDTLIHESVHVFQGAMEYVGETVLGKETQAYHIANIATNLMKDFHALHEERET